MRRSFARDRSPPGVIDEEESVQECVLDWLKEVETDTLVNTFVVGRVVHATVEKDYLLPEVRASFTKRAIPYHFAEFYSHQDKRCSGGEGSGFCQLDVEGFDFAG